MNIGEQISDLVGNTPMVRIRKLSSESGTQIIGKLEWLNPMASVKDRIAVAMINVAEKKGELEAGSLIVEPTSGNTGIGLAFVAAERGYRLILTMPDSMSIERRKLLKAFGAKVVLTPGHLGMKGAVDKAIEIHNENPGSLMPQQFDNPENPNIHRLTTGEEIWRDTDGKVDIFVAGVGTGGTITGCGQVLKSRNPNIRIVAVEPEESAVLSGEKPWPHRIQGLGPGFIPRVLDTTIYDEIIKVNSQDAVYMARGLAKTEGLLVGISSGAAMFAAWKLAQREENKNKMIVVILPDSGERYLSTCLFEDLE